jgi:hypothetical protein
VGETEDGTDFRRNALDFAALGGGKRSFIEDFRENRVFDSEYQVSVQVMRLPVQEVRGG